MRKRCSEMLSEYYYIDLLKDRLKYQQDWIRQVYVYRRCTNIYKKVETTNTEAYEYYLKAKYKYEKRNG